MRPKVPQSDGSSIDKPDLTPQKASESKSTVTVLGDGESKHNGLKTTASLWDRAYDALKKEDPQLLGKYENLLSNQIQTLSTYTFVAFLSIGV